MDARDDNGGTALIQAADRGNAEIVGLFIDRGAEVNVKDKDGHTALTYATHMSRTEIAELLKAAGAKEQALKNTQLGLPFGVVGATLWSPQRSKTTRAAELKSCCTRARL